MPLYSSEQYNEIFDKLPIELKDIIASYTTTQKLIAIGQKHLLHIDKVGIMIDLTFDVVMGILASKDFLPELTRQLDIPAIEASALARDIDEIIFKPIKEVMMEVYADGAPNKPGSSLSHTYEEEEGHPHLDPDQLLREIENPTEASIRTEMTEIAYKSPAPKSTPVPLAAPVVVKEVSKPTEEKVAPLTNEKKKLVETIGAIDISKAFVMPKIPTDLPIIPANPSAPSIAKEPVAGEAAKISAPTPTAEKRADPYREPLN